MVSIHVFEHDALPVQGCARRVGDIVVIVLVPGLSAHARHDLMQQLLTPGERANLNVEGL